MHTRVTLSVFMPTGFDVTVYVRTEDRWLAAMTAIQHCLHLSEEKYINSIHTRLAEPKEGATVLEPIDAKSVESCRPLGGDRRNGGDLSMAGSEG